MEAQGPSGRWLPLIISAPFRCASLGYILQGNARGPDLAGLGAACRRLCCGPAALHACCSS